MSKPWPRVSKSEIAGDRVDTGMMIIHEATVKRTRKPTVADKAIRKTPQRTAIETIDAIALEITELLEQDLERHVRVAALAAKSSADMARAAILAGNLDAAVNHSTAAVHLFNRAFFVATFELDVRARINSLDGAIASHRLSPLWDFVQNWRQERIVSGKPTSAMLAYRACAAKRKELPTVEAFRSSYYRRFKKG